MRINLIVFNLLVFVIFYGCEDVGGELIYTTPSDSSNFHFSYFLFLPEDISKNETLSLIVEPNNSGFASDELNEHTEKAMRQATKDFYLGNYVAREFKYPLLVPVFPRPKSDWKIYTHALDRDVILQKNNELERLDLQLIAMIEHAKNQLRVLEYVVEDKVLMTGFSASGSFANRFSLIHPDKLKACVAGGVNGLLMLPLDTLNGKQFNYPLGTNDFEALFGRPFDAVSFKELHQYLFMGELDENDAIPFEDGYDTKERDLVFEVLGKEMQPKRWNRCKEIYNEIGINATIVTYSGIGHDHPKKVKQDIVDFFKKQLYARSGIIRDYNK